jgi:hypothetical protein
LGLTPGRVQFRPGFSIPDMRSPLFKKIQRISHYMMVSAQARGELRGWSGGKCVDCGDTDPLVFHDDHRDYSEPYKIETVCPSCNTLRGAALLELFNVETAQWERVL